MRSKSPVTVGPFTVTPSILGGNVGAIRVTDPCYDREVWCCGTFPALAGSWYGLIEYDDATGRVSRLAVYHSTARDAVPGKASGLDVGVDSGQCGFFDEARYPMTKEAIGDYDDKNSFYGKACAATSYEPIDTAPRGGAVEDMGVVSSSGWGDGSYECRLAERMNVADGTAYAIAADVTFIGEEEEDEYDGDEDEGVDETIPELITHDHDDEE